MKLLIYFVPIIYLTFLVLFHHRAVPRYLIVVKFWIYVIGSYSLLKGILKGKEWYIKFNERYLHRYKQ
jgi:hypothetical protein